MVQPARGRCERAGDVLGRSFAARKTLERIDGFGELGRRLGLAALDAVDAFADPAELGGRVAVGGIDAEFQRRQFDPRLHHVLFEPLDVLEGRSSRRDGGNGGGPREAVGRQRAHHAAERRRQRERRRQDRESADVRRSALLGRLRGSIIGGRGPSPR